MNSFSLEYKIDQPKAIVWDNFFNKINRWWSKELFTSPRTKLFIIDTVIGGRMYEHFGEGEGLVWGDVIGVDCPNSLQVKGMLSGDFGGPAISFDKFIFEGDEAQTTLRFSVEFIGEVSEKTLNSIKTGWEKIFDDHFLPFCKE